MTVKKASPNKGVHYVNNAEFSQAVVTYTLQVRDARSKDQPEPRIPDYIGDCFLKIAKRLSYRPNFSGYSWREDMELDAIENCVRAIMNFDPDVVTRTGKLNAFSYFTQICFYAFLRRMQKEKKQQQIKEAMIDNLDMSAFATGSDSDDSHERQVIDSIRSRHETPGSAKVPKKKVGKKRSSKDGVEKPVGLYEYAEEDEDRSN
jgi:hypothetical protein